LATAAVTRPSDGGGLQRPLRRIVSLVPSTTESVFAFGRGDWLVGCTRYCKEPREPLAAVPRIGGTKNPRRDAIMALEPDLVLANAEENRAEDLLWLGERVPLLVQTPCTVAEALTCLHELAGRLDAVAAARSVLQRIERAAAAAAPGQQPLRVFFPIWKKPWMSANATTFVRDVLRCAGAANVCDALPARYPEVTPEWVRSQAPEAVLLPSEPWEFTSAERDELAAASVFGAVPVELCDGRDFCWHGARLAEGLDRAAAVVAQVRRLARAEQ
jgi:ABC-type Fe3+-hydroxamate transport system substrate-binding protein